MKEKYDKNETKLKGKENKKNMQNDNKRKKVKKMEDGVAVRKKRDDISVERMFPFSTIHFLIVVSKHWVQLIKLRDPLHNENQSFLLSIANRWMASVPI